MLFEMISKQEEVHDLICRSLELDDTIHDLLMVDLSDISGRVSVQQLVAISEY